MQMDDPTDQAAASDENDDSELMQALGAEVRKYFDEQISILLARLDSRMDSQTEILLAIKELQMALTADRVIINDSQGRPAGIRSILPS
jgi:hypothetical protein